MHGYTNHENNAVVYHHHYLSVSRMHSHSIVLLLSYLLQNAFRILQWINCGFNRLKLTTWDVQLIQTRNLQWIVHFVQMLYHNVSGIYESSCVISSSKKFKQLKRSLSFMYMSMQAFYPNLQTCLHKGPLQITYENIAPFSTRHG